MNDKIAIKVEGVSKQYKIGKEKDDSLRGTLMKIFTNKSKAHEEFWALKDISFEVEKGDVIGIIGKNGAGKSTLLKILSQITQPTKGKISINGRIASLLEVGTGFHPELTGRENIYLNGTILGMTRKEVKAKFEEIVAFSGIEKFIDTPVKHYSSGMYVRLAFSVAAHLEPEILIIDEVLAVGDAEFQKKCLGKMKDVAGQGRTVLFVSHHLGSVRQLCNKGILINAGKVTFLGNTEETIRRYQENSKIAKTYTASLNRDTVFINTAYINSDNISFDYSDEIPLHFQLSNVEGVKGDVRLLFRIKNQDENVITGQEIHLKNNCDNYSYVLPSHFFMKGKYTIETIIYSPAIEQFEVIENILEFEILQNPPQFSHLETFNLGNVQINKNWGVC